MKNLIDEINKNVAIIDVKKEIDEQEFLEFTKKAFAYNPNSKATAFIIHDGIFYNINTPEGNEMFKKIYKEAQCTSKK